MFAGADAEIKFKVDLDSAQAESGVNKLKASTVALGNLMSAGIQKGTQSLIDLGKQALSSSADLEQNIGGIETLFKDSADEVIKKANNAFKTAGMSANEYMSTVTGFSASLLQGLAGDTEKASKLADLAVTDMSDNANKMGTSMELIQNAYQGFAKQNYTMLDNLKLGYGGTASEMARLINDSGVLGDSMEVTAETVNQVSFDKIIEAIHKIQDNMGITGTTSKEAAETISGSVSSMKAAFDNFLNGSGDVDTLIDTVTTVAKNISKKIIEMAPQIIDGLVELINFVASQLPTLIQELLPTLTTAVVNLITGLVSALPGIITSLATVLPEIINVLVQGLIQIVNALAMQLPTLIPTLVTAILGIIPVLIQNLPLFLDAGFQLLMGLLDGIINSIPVLIENLPKIISSIIEFIVNNLPKIISMGIKILLALIKGLIQSIPQLIASIPQIITAIVNGLKDGISKIGDVGKDLVKGLWNGIKNAKDWVLDKIKGFGESVLNGIKDFFGIHSPSTEFAWIGKMNILGLEEGMEDNIPDLNKTIDRTIDYSYDTAGLDFLQNGADNVSGMISSGFVNSSSSSPVYVTVNANMDVNKFGKAFVRDIKTFSGGAKNSYNYGGSK